MVLEKIYKNVGTKATKFWKISRSPVIFLRLKKIEKKNFLFQKILFFVFFTFFIGSFLVMYWYLEKFFVVQRTDFIKKFKFLE